MVSLRVDGSACLLQDEEAGVISTRAITARSILREEEEEAEARRQEQEEEEKAYRRELEQEVASRRVARRGRDPLGGGGFAPASSHQGAGRTTDARRARDPAVASSSHQEAGQSSGSRRAPDPAAEAFHNHRAEVLRQRVLEDLFLEECCYLFCWGGFVCRADVRSLCMLASVLQLWRCWGAVGLWVLVV